MRFKSVRIKDFRRFTDLAVQGVPETARLILLAGRERLWQVIILRRTPYMASRNIGQRDTMG